MDDLAQLPSGPSLAPMRQEIALRTRQREFVLECQQQYGDAFTLRLPGSPPVVFVTTPQAARDLLTLDEETHFHSLAADQLFLTLMGSHSLLVLRGAPHKRLRDMLIKPFGSDKNDGYTQLLSRTIDAGIRQLPRGRPIEFYPAIEKIAWHCIVHLVLGTTDPSRVQPMVQQLQAIREVAIHSVLFKLLRPAGTIRLERLQRLLPSITPWGRFLRRIRRLNSLIETETARVRAEPENPGLLAMILRARDAQGNAMTPAEVRDSLVLLITGGVETVASTCVQLLYRLFFAPEIKARLETELRAANPDSEFSYRALQRFTYLDWVTRESMRLDPAFCQIRRTLKVPQRIGDVFIPADTAVAVSTYAIHHREEIWPRANSFDPDRFQTARPGPFDMIPFGVGPHRCPGANIGTIEVKLVMAYLFSSLDVQLEPGFQGNIIPDGPVWSVTRGLPVILRDRTAGH